MVVLRPSAPASAAESGTLLAATTEPTFPGVDGLGVGVGLGVVDEEGVGDAITDAVGDMLADADGLGENTVGGTHVSMVKTAPPKNPVRWSNSLAPTIKRPTANGGVPSKKARPDPKSAAILYPNGYSDSTTKF